MLYGKGPRLSQKVCVGGVPYLCRIGGALVAQLVEHAIHIQRLCPCCSGPGFNSDLQPFDAVSPPPPHPVISQAVPTKKL